MPVVTHTGPPVPKKRRGALTVQDSATPPVIPDTVQVMSGIGTLNESPLHAAIKDYVALPGDRFEVDIDGFVADIVRDDEIIEVQTARFGAMTRKLDRLLEGWHITIVHPIAIRTWIERPDRPRRRSPARRSAYHVFEELVSIPTLLDHPHLRLRILLIEELQHRAHDPNLRRRRGGWRVVERELISVVDDWTMTDTDDLAGLLPADLPDPFTTADLARAAAIPRPLAQKVAYCLRLSGLANQLDRTRQGVRYSMR